MSDFRRGGPVRQLRREPLPLLYPTPACPAPHPFAPLSYAAPLRNIHEYAGPEGTHQERVRDWDLRQADQNQYDRYDHPHPRTYPPSYAPQAAPALYAPQHLTYQGQPQGGFAGQMSVDYDPTPRQYGRPDPMIYRDPPSQVASGSIAPSQSASHPGRRRHDIEGVLDGDDEPAGTEVSANNVMENLPGHTNIFHGPVTINITEAPNGSASARAFRSSRTWTADEMKAMMAAFSAITVEDGDKVKKEAENADWHEGD